MSHYETEENNLAQHIEGFACGYDKNEDYHLLTPEQSEKESELDDNIYEATEEEAEPVSTQPDLMDAQVDEPEASMPVPKKELSPTCVYSWLLNSDNRMYVVLGLIALLIVVYFLYNNGMFVIPKSVPNFSKTLGLDSVSSFAGTSSSLGADVAKLAVNNLI